MKHVDIPLTIIITIYTIKICKIQKYDVLFQKNSIIQLYSLDLLNLIQTCSLSNYLLDS